LIKGWGITWKVNSAVANYLESITPSATANIVWSAVGREAMQFVPWETTSLIDNVPRVYNFLKTNVYGGVPKLSFFSLALNIWLKLFRLQLMEYRGYNGGYTTWWNCNQDAYSSFDFIPTLEGPGYLPFAQTINQSNGFDGWFLVVDEEDFVATIMPNYKSYQGFIMMRPRFSSVRNNKSHNEVGYIAQIPDASDIMDLNYLIYSHLSSPDRFFSFNDGVVMDKSWSYNNHVNLQLGKAVMLILPGTRNAGAATQFTTPTGVNLTWSANNEVDLTGAQANNIGRLSDWDKVANPNNNITYTSYMTWASSRMRYFISPEEWSAAYTWVSAMSFGTFQPKWANSTGASPFWSVGANYGQNVPMWPDTHLLDHLKVTVIPTYDVRTAWMWTSQLMVPEYNVTTEKVHTLASIGPEYIHLDMQRMATQLTNAFDVGAIYNGVGVGENMRLLNNMARKNLDRWWSRYGDYSDIQVASVLACNAIGAIGYDSLYALTRTLDTAASFQDISNSMVGTCLNSLWSWTNGMLTRVDPIELVAGFKYYPITAKFLMSKNFSLMQRNFIPDSTVGSKGLRKREKQAETDGAFYSFWGWNSKDEVGLSKVDDFQMVVHRAICQSISGVFNIQLRLFVGGSNSTTMLTRIGLCRYSPVAVGGNPWAPPGFLQPLLDADNFIVETSLRWMSYAPMDLTGGQTVTIISARAHDFVRGIVPVIEYSLTGGNTMEDPLDSLTSSVQAWSKQRVKIIGDDDVDEKQDEVQKEPDTTPTTQGDEMKETTGTPSTE
jgi:hypothetical protein